MRALTLTQPYAQLVILGRKRFETRGWTTGYRGLLAIHAAKGWTAEDRQYARDQGLDPDALPLGAVVGEVSLRAVYDSDHALTFVGAAEERMGDYSSGRYAWELAVPRRYVEPIPAKGRLGLWYWQP